MSKGVFFCDVKKWKIKRGIAIIKTKSKAVSVLNS